MTKKALETRRQRNRELALVDASRRCGSCKRELPKTGVKMRWADSRMYCSDACLADAGAAEKLREDRLRENRLRENRG